MNGIDKKIKSIIIKLSKEEIYAEDINDNSILTTDFGFDSIQIVELVVEIENEFNITMEDEDLDIKVLTTFSLLKELIEKKQCN